MQAGVLGRLWGVNMGVRCVRFRKGNERGVAGTKHRHVDTVPPMRQLLIKFHTEVHA